MFGISLLALSGYVGKYVNYFYNGSIPPGTNFGMAGLVFLVGIFVVIFFSKFVSKFIRRREPR